MKPDKQPDVVSSLCMWQDDESTVGPPADPDLVAEGWQRRHMVDLERAAESEALYRQLGFEVRLQELKPADFQAKCQACASSVCRAYVMVYTRRK